MQYACFFKNNAPVKSFKITQKIPNHFVCVDRIFSNKYISLKEIFKHCILSLDYKNKT